MTEGYREDGREDRSVLVVAFNGKIFGIEPSSGVVRWSHALGYHGEIEIQFRPGRVFAATSKVLYCLEYPSGTVLGQVPLLDRYGGRPTMVIERDQIFIGTNGELSCFDLQGKVLWVQPFQGLGFGSVALGFPGNVRQADDAGSR